ncbi:MAG: MoaD/ThiS family protein [Desulfopila sp.]|jgi:sulfur carrier protein ThiS|nr:MoaD/ThiS family protein [Desulfopila sp.]
MVKITFKLSDRGTVELDIPHALELKALIDQYSVTAKTDLGGYIAVRNGKVISAETLVEDNDEIDIFPAISGG